MNDEKDFINGPKIIKDLFDIEKQADQIDVPKVYDAIHYLLNMTIDEIKLLDGKYFPQDTKEFKFSVHVIKSPVPGLMQDQIQLGIEYEGVLYDSKMPESEANYLLYLICKQAEMEPMTVQQIVDKAKNQQISNIIS